MTETTKEQITPDELMEHFQGSSLKTIIIFTVVVHAVLLVGTSIPSIIKSVAGGDTEGMSEGERMELAMREANASLREIAEEHGLKPQDLSSQFAGGRKRTAKPTPPPPAAAAATPESPTPPGGDPATNPETEKSSIEKELEKTEEGPAVPKIEDEEEDLFK